MPTTRPGRLSASVLTSQHGNITKDTAAVASVKEFITQTAHSGT